MNTFDEFLSSSGRKLSPMQMEVVESDVATVVSAGAGSGKTTVLSYRFLRLVMEKKASADEILTLTFTKKAAAEMHGRIYSLMNEVSKSSPLVKSQMKNLASAYISTLDSFSSEVARTDSARYGISRDFDVLDEDEEHKLIKATVSLLFERHQEKMLPLSRFFNPESVSSNLFELLSNEVTILTEFDTESTRNTYISFLNRIEKYFLKYAFCVLDEMESYKSAETSSSPLFKDCDESIESIRAYLRERRYEKLPKFNLNSMRAKVYAPIKEIINSRWRPLLPLFSSLAENENSDFSYLDVFSLFISELNKEKRRRGVLTFSDISALALMILKSNPTVRAYYKKKFKYIMIDEFQDNSSDQKDLLYILSEKEDVHGLGVPDKEDLDNTKLFFVGDDKQSIYAFRKADVSVFNSLKEEIASIGGRFLSMRENYRSEPALISHFNNIFPSIMAATPLDDYSRCVEDFLSAEAGRDLSLYEASFESIVARDEKEGIRGSVTYAKSEEMEEGLDESDSSESEDEKLSDAENEAEYIASLIGRITSDEAFSIPCGDGARKATYDDIAILYRTSKSQMPLEKVFRRVGIPYTVISSNSITMEAITFDFTAFISLLLFPMDKRSYLAVLRSPFIRLSDEALMSMRDFFSSYELSGEPFTHILSSFSSDDSANMAALRDFYLSLKEDMGRLSAEKLLDRLYYESGYSSYIESKMSLSSYREHYEYLWEIARRMENIFDFHTYLRERMDSSSKLDIELLRKSMGGVRLMNIHKSKGLEFPIVILAGTNSRPLSAEPAMLIHSTSPEFITLDLSSTKGIKKVFNDAKKRRLASEAKRLLYVALTRAESHLVVVASGSKIRSGTLASLYDEAALNDGAVRQLRFKTIGEDEIERKWEEANVFPAFYDKEVLVRGTYKENKVGIKSINHEGEEIYTLTGEYRRLKDFDGGVDMILSRNKLYPDFGTLLHGFLESYFKKVSPPDYRNVEIGRGGIAALMAEAERIKNSFISSPFYINYIEGCQVLSEERFCMPYGDMVAEGSIDLLVLKKEYNLVVDYKSDREYNPDYHKGQILSYVKAAESIHKKKCYGVLLYLRSMENGPFWDSEGNVITL